MILEFLLHRSVPKSWISLLGNCLQFPSIFNDGVISNPWPEQSECPGYKEE
jgi:hypothetical protein